MVLYSSSSLEPKHSHLQRTLHHHKRRPPLHHLPKAHQGSRHKAMASPSLLHHLHRPLLPLRTPPSTQCRTAINLRQCSSNLPQPDRTTTAESLPPLRHKRPPSVIYPKPTIGSPHTLALGPLNLGKLPPRLTYLRSRNNLNSKMGPRESPSSKLASAKSHLRCPP